MKGIDIFSQSQPATATAISLNMDEPSSSSSSPSSSSSSLQLEGPGALGRAIDRYNPIIRDPRRVTQSPSRPTTPKPPQHNQQSVYRKGVSKAKNDQFSKKKNSLKGNDQKRKNIVEEDNNIVTRKGWGCNKPGEFISPPGSTRYLLSDEDGVIFDKPTEIDQPAVLNLARYEASKSIEVKLDELAEEKSPSSRSPEQVVVLRVSLHCRGCERKMRKHIAKMEGVTSFNIDFAAKKVTVVGDVTPLQVLTSISKVKNAKLWTAPTLSSLASPFNNFELKKYQEVGGALSRN